MSNVIPLKPHPVSPEREPATQTPLHRWGWRFGRLLTGLLGVVVAFAIAVLTLGLVCGGAYLWLAPGAAYIGLAPAGVSGLVSFGDLPWPTRWAYAATFVLDTAPVLAILVELRGLALSYSTGIAFSAAGTRCLRRIGLWLVAYAIAPALGHALVLLAGHGVDLDWLHASSFQALVLAILAVVLAEVTRVGHALQLDRDGFI